MDVSTAFTTPTLQNPTVLYYGVDHLGTVRAVVQVDESGNETGRLSTYEPFGLEIPPIDTCDNTHRFTGHERDPETDSDYMHFRYYAGSMGRFSKPDNVTGNAMNPQDWNLYSYVHGNPINFNDPTGHIPGKFQFMKLTKEGSEGWSIMTDPGEGWSAESQEELQGTAILGQVTITESPTADYSVSGSNGAAIDPAATLPATRDSGSSYTDLSDNEDSTLAWIAKTDKLIAKSQRESESMLVLLKNQALPFYAVGVPKSKETRFDKVLSNNLSKLNALGISDTKALLDAAYSFGHYHIGKNEPPSIVDASSRYVTYAKNGTAVWVRDGHNVYFLRSGLHENRLDNGVSNHYWLKVPLDRGW